MKFVARIWLWFITAFLRFATWTKRSIQQLEADQKSNEGLQDYLLREAEREKRIQLDPKNIARIKLSSKSPCVTIVDLTNKTEEVVLSSSLDPAKEISAPASPPYQQAEDTYPKTQGERDALREKSFQRWTDSIIANNKE